MKRPSFLNRLTIPPGQGDEDRALNAPTPEPADEDQTVLLNHTAAQGAANNMMGAASLETEPAAALQEDDATFLLASSPSAEPAEGGDETVLLGGPSGAAAYPPPPQQEIPAPYRLRTGRRRNTYSPASQPLLPDSRNIFRRFSRVGPCPPAMPRRPLYRRKIQLCKRRESLGKRKGVACGLRLFAYWRLWY